MSRSSVVLMRVVIFVVRSARFFCGLSLSHLWAHFDCFANKMSAKITENRIFIQSTKRRTHSMTRWKFRAWKRKSAKIVASIINLNFAKATRAVLMEQMKRHVCLVQLCDGGQNSNSSVIVIIIISIALSTLAPSWWYTQYVRII